MKTSKPTRLSEKLNAELDTIRQDYAASMASQLENLQDWITGRTDKKPHMTLNDLVSELAEHYCIAIHRVSVWRFLRSLGLTHKKMTSKPSSRSGPRSGRRALSGSRGVSPSCATCCHALVSSTRPR